MPQLLVETTEGLGLPHEIAGAGSRALAGALDVALVVALLLAALAGLSVVERVDPSGLSTVAKALLVGGGFLLQIAYHVLFSVFWDGRTLGKAAVGIRVRDAGGDPATPVQHFLRGLFLPLECWLLVPVPVGVILIAGSERCQRLGDLVAGTLVLRDPRAEEALDPYEERSWAQLPDRRLGLAPAIGARFGAEDVRFLRALFGRRGLEEAARKRLFLRSGQHYASVLGVEAPRSPGEARTLLRELYLFLRDLRAGYSSTR